MFLKFIPVTTAVYCSIVSDYFDDSWSVFKGLSSQEDDCMNVLALFHSEHSLLSTYSWWFGKPGMQAPLVHCDNFKIQNSTVEHVTYK